MLASTRLPMPVVSVSDRFWANVAWIENFAAPADNLARAELTLVSEVWMVATRVEALAWVEIVAVDLHGHDGAGQAHILGLRGDATRTVGGRQRRDLRGRAIHQVEAVEHRVCHDRGNLIAQRGEVGIQGLTAGSIERSVSRGKRLLLQLDQQVRDGLAGGQRNVDRGRAVVDRVDDGLIAGNRATLILGDGVDGAIVTRGGNLHAAVDGALGLGQRALGRR